MIYGLNIYKRAYDVTDRVGIRTLTIARNWQPSRWNLTEAEIDAEEPGPPAVEGGMELIGHQCLPNGGLLRSSWTFEGVNGNGKDVTFKDRAHTEDYGCDSGMSQVPLQHFRGNKGSQYKSFQALLDAFGGTADPESGQLVWPMTLDGSQGSRGLAKAALSGDNPMFGQTDFFRPEGSYWCRYCAFDVPDSLYDGVGSVWTDLPGRPPVLREGRNFLKIEPIWRTRGKIKEILERYWISGPGGWLTPVYGGGSSNGSGPGGGLTTGTLITGTL